VDGTTGWLKFKQTNKTALVESARTAEKNHATFKTRKVVHIYRVERGFSKIQKYA
jgi:hypothetical protein